MLEVRIDVQWSVRGVPRVSAQRRKATREDSKRRIALPGALRRVPGGSILRLALGIAGLAGAVFLIVASFSTIIEIKVLTTSEIAAPIDTVLSGSERHGPALVLLGAFGLLMLLGALRGARPAALAVAVAGVAALGIAVLSDLPDLDETGEVGELYEQASAGPEAGYYLETAGGALLLVAGVGLFVLAGSGTPDRREAEPEPERPRSSDWFADDPA